MLIKFLSIWSFLKDHWIKLLHIENCQLNHVVGQPLEKCGDKIPRWYLSQKMIAPFIPVICLWNFVTFFSMEVLIHFTSVPRKKNISSLNLVKKVQSQTDKFWLH